MNGFEVLKYVKNSKNFNSIPIIMISSMDDKDSIYRCIEMGADDYVTKPFDKEILNARISSSIERKQLRDKEKKLIDEIQYERERSEKLLLNILPQEIANKLKNKEKDISKRHENVTIIFTDLVNFTPQAKKLSAGKVVKVLNELFKEFDDLITYLIISIIVGGRLGYVIFYNLEYYISNPVEIIKVWEGGMSFHGALIGIIIGTYRFSIKKNIPTFFFPY